MKITQRSRKALVALLAGTFAVAIAGGGVAGADQRRERSAPMILVAHGGFTSPPLTITNVQPSGSGLTFDVAGGDVWTGTLNGTTSYTGTGYLDPATGEGTLRLDETFTGTVRGLGTGTLHNQDFAQFHGDGSNTVEDFIVDGTGQLHGVRGYLHFVGQTDGQDGPSAGSYDGFLVRS